MHIPGYVLLPSDTDIAARTIAREAGAERFDGQVAVAEVIINRVRTSLALGRRLNKLQVQDHTISAACLRYLQFSCWNLQDPNRAKALALVPSDRLYRTALDAFMLAWESDKDITEGATCYHTIQAPRGAKTWPPYWAASMRRTVDIGAHRFYK